MITLSIYRIYSVFFCKGGREEVERDVCKLVNKFMPLKTVQARRGCIERVLFERVYHNKRFCSDFYCVHFGSFHVTFLLWKTESGIVGEHFLWNHSKHFPTGCTRGLGCPDPSDSMACDSCTSVTVSLFFGGFFLSRLLILCQRKRSELTFF